MVKAQLKVLRPFESEGLTRFQKIFLRAILHGQPLELNPRFLFARPQETLEKGRF